MNKSQIISEILAKPFVLKEISTEKVSDLLDGTKIYHCYVLEVVENAAIGRTIPFYVVNEGQANEAAYYKDLETIAQIQPFLNKIKPLLKQYNGRVIEQGETWALAETNSVISSNGVNSIVKDQYFLVDGEPLSITKIG